MYEKLKKQSIDRLDISNNANDILKENKILTLGEICKKNKKELKNYGLSLDIIKEIELELQLIGLSLKG